jgi:hypothetical protein
LSPSSQTYGFGIQDQRSRKNLFRIPDLGVKKEPDPGSRSATLAVISSRSRKLRINKLKPSGRSGSQKKLIQKFIWYQNQTIMQHIR